MCGIIGIYAPGGPPPQQDTLSRMLASLRHRGPDQFGIYLDHEVGLGNARLSIIDLSGGQQPISNEDGSLWIIFNGEIFNYVELRPGLEARGHVFTTHSDTEVILHLYEEMGPDCLNELNGQFAIAIWDNRKRQLFLGRDRVGILPLFYAPTPDGKGVIFGSEVKSLLASGMISAELDPVALQQTFTFWSPAGARSPFRGIKQVLPGQSLLIDAQGIHAHTYWHPIFPDAEAQKAEAWLPPSSPRYQALVDEFRSLLVDATQIRLRADVPVGAYLSGGLDSSATSAAIRRFTSNRLDTFSVAFSDPHFDESAYQYRMADHLGTEHQVVHVDYPDIGQAFLDALWHTEAPILRTAPAPLFLLSQKVRQTGYKVVLTGEGADEFLAGYDIFKESILRRFWARRPESTARPALLTRLYPDIATLADARGYMSAFFGEGLQDTASPYYSHAIRWRNTSRTRRFFSSALSERIAAQPGVDELPSVPDGFQRWHPLNQAQYLEITLFLANYLLCSQGDRMTMSHSVEGRFPFLDHRLIEFANRLPADLKLRGLTEKYLLRQAVRDWLPAEIGSRPKRPYRAPIQRSLLAANVAPQVLDELSPDAIRRAGFFKPEAVQALLGKAQRPGVQLSETDEMALAGILSTQVVQRRFVETFRMPEPLTPADDLKVIHPAQA